MLRRLVKIVLVLAVVLVAGGIAALGGFRMWAAAREAADPATLATVDPRFVEVSGLQVHYREWGPEAGPPILLVHGALAWSGTFDLIAEPLAAQGLRVIAPDVPPFGFSARPANGDYGRAAQASIIVGFADAIGLGRFVLAGHSFGGGATVEAAFAMEDRIAGLALLDVALGLGATEAPAPPLASLLASDGIRDIVVAATMTNPLLTGYGLRAFVEDDTLVTAERVALYQRPLAMRGTTEAVGDWMMSGLYGDHRRLRSADLGSYRAFAPPVLVIWGFEDSVTPLEQGETIAAAFPRGRLEVLDGVNHIPQIESPAEVARLLGDFVRATLKPAEPVVSQDKGPRLTVAE